MKYYALVLLISLTLAPSAQAELSTMAGTTANPNRALSATARLDFNINIDKFIYFSIGNTTSIDTVSLSTTPSIPTSSSAVIPSTGNNKAVPWNGAAPSFTSTAVSLPVQVRSNAGQVSLRTTVSSPLSNTSGSLPFSALNITSSDSNLPAPPVPDTGTGSAVNVTPSSYGLVTSRDATWSFAYNSTQALNPGVYTGQLLFTASAP